MPTNHSDSDVTPAQIRAQRDRILASKLFSLSRRQCDFLAYIVDAALDGQQDKLKEFTLGIDVFERDESYDPSIDSIVRVEASRLRAKLREYYSDTGSEDPVRITIPKGHYAPTFHRSESASRKPEVPPRRFLWLGVTVTMLAVTFFFVNDLLRTDEPGSIARTRQAATPSSIAVLPLRDRSAIREDYFSDAMTDALISSLAKMRPLKVTSFTSIMQYKNTESPASDIGRALGVAYIVEGSVIRDNERGQVTANLIEATSDTLVWSKDFDVSMTDMQTVHGQVAAAIAAQISNEMQPLIRSQNTERNPAAYEAYMKGRYFYNKFTAAGYRRSMEFFQEAIAIDSDYAEAYAGLASCHCLLAGHGLEMVSPVISIPQAHAHAMRALSLDSELAEPIAFLGIIDFKFGWDPASAETRLAQAIALNPNLYQAYVWHSQILEAMGRHDEAVERARYAKQLNPLSLAASLNLGWQMYQAGQYIEAVSEIDDLIEFNPQFWGGHWVRGHIYNRHQVYEKALSEFQRAVELEGGHSLPLSALGYTYAVAGMPDMARQTIADLDVLSRDSYVSPFHVAIVYAGLNDADLMFEWLERAYDVRARSLAWMQVTNELRPFRDDSRYHDLLARIGISPVIVPHTQARIDP